LALLYTVQLDGDPPGTVVVLAADNVELLPVTPTHGGGGGGGGGSSTLGSSGSGGSGRSAAFPRLDPTPILCALSVLDSSYGDDGGGGGGGGASDGGSDGGAGRLVRQVIATLANAEQWFATRQSGGDSGGRSSPASPAAASAAFRVASLEGGFDLLLACGFTISTVESASADIELEFPPPLSLGPSGPLAQATACLEGFLARG